jgi:hypothetical protein
MEALQRLADSPTRALSIVVDSDVNPLADLEGAASRLIVRLAVYVPKDPLAKGQHHYQCSGQAAESAGSLDGFILPIF